LGAAISSTMVPPRRMMWEAAPPDGSTHVMRALPGSSVSTCAFTFVGVAGAPGAPTAGRVVHTGADGADGASPRVAPSWKHCSLPGGASPGTVYWLWSPSMSRTTLVAAGVGEALVAGSMMYTL
jgi:hypothetical protein